MKLQTAPPSKSKVLKKKTSKTVAKSTKKAESKKPAVVAETEPAAEKSSDESEFWAELQIMSNIAQVERERLEIESEIEEVQGNVRRCKSALKDVEGELGEVRDSLKEKTDELLELARKLLNTSSGKTLPVVKDDGGEGWQVLSTKQLLSGTKGLTAKKIEAIADLAANVGQLEDLRGRASRENQQFNEVLPKGIGKGVAQTIEDKLIEHIAKFQMAQASPERQKLADDLLKEVRTLASDSRWTAEDCHPKPADSEDMHAGYTAFKEGRTHASFVSEDHTRAKDWMIGWVSAEVIQQAEAA